MENLKDSKYIYADLSIPCPEKSNRTTVFFRLFCAIPIFIIMILLEGCYIGSPKSCFISIALFAPTLLTILFAKYYSKTWFDWSYYLTKLSARLFAYIFLLRDEFPAIDNEQAVKVDLRYPQAATELNRALPLVKWFLAIPHYIVLSILFSIVLVLTILVWFIILFTGHYPKSIHKFVVGVFRWAFRVNAYAFLLVTDKYPPFSL